MGQSSPAWLGGRQTGNDYGCSISPTGEIVPLPPLTPVPLTNHGSPASPTSVATCFGRRFSALRGGPPLNPASRLLLVGARHGSNAALLVTRMLGLKTRINSPPLPP